MYRSVVLALLALLVAAAPAGAADPRRGEQWNLDLIEADAARAISTGAGAVVAVVDSGVQADHPDLAGRVGPGYDEVQRDATPQDGDGHGTHVLGIVGAASGNGVGVESVAPGATLMPIRVLGDDGGGSIDDVARGVDYARTHGADVINLSLGSEVPLVGAAEGDALDAAIRRAIAAGIVVVARRRQQRRAGLRAARGGRRPAVRGRGRQAPPALVLLLLRPRARPRGARRVRRHRRRDGGRRGRPLDVRGTRPIASSRAPRRPRRTWPGSPRCSWRAACAGRPRSSASSPPRPTSAPPGNDAEYGAGLVNARAAVAGLGGAGAARPAPGRRRARRAALPLRAGQAAAAGAHACCAAASGVRVRSVRARAARACG